MDIAVDRRLQRQVARKSPRSRDPRILARLAQEALITAHLDHPGIVPVFDAGVDDDGSPFYSMRLVRGKSLESALSDCPRLQDRLSFLRQYLTVCEAVAYAHAKGIVHRDIKPENIMLGDFGETQIVDWGVAKPVAEVIGEAWHRHILPKDVAVETLFGDIIGTPAYMAPEQAQPGAPASVAADIWSLGAVLFRLVFGFPPVGPSKDSGEVLKLVREGRQARVDDAEQALRSQGESTPPELQAIVKRAMAVSPLERYADALTLSRDVAAFLDGRRVMAYRYSTFDEFKRIVKAWKIPISFGAAGLVVLGSVLFFAAGRVVDERDRALAAEDIADANARIAARRLSDSLVAQGAQHLHEGRRPESELLASQAYLMTGDPEAMGLLMATSDTGGPFAAGIARLPDHCTRLELSERGERALCSSLDLVELYTLRPSGQPHLEWSRPARHTHALWGPATGSAPNATYVTVVLDDRRVAVLDATTGEVVTAQATVRSDADVHKDAIHVQRFTGTQGASGAMSDGNGWAFEPQAMPMNDADPLGVPNERVAPSVPLATRARDKPTISETYSDIQTSDGTFPKSDGTFSGGERQPDPIATTPAIAQPNEYLASNWPPLRASTRVNAIRIHGPGPMPLLFHFGQSITAVTTAGIKHSDLICRAPAHVEALAQHGQNFAAVCNDAIIVRGHVSPAGIITTTSSNPLSPSTRNITPNSDPSPGHIAALTANGLLATITPRGRLHLQWAAPDGSFHDIGLDTGILSATDLRPSPDGRYLAVAVVKGGVSILSLAPDQLGRRLHTLPAPHGRHLRWSSAGLLTAGRLGAITWAPFDAPAPSHQYGPTNAPGLASLDISPDGTLVALGGAGGRLGIYNVMDRTGFEVAPHNLVLKRVRFDATADFLHFCGAGLVGLHRQSRHRPDSPSDSWPVSPDALRRIERLADGRWLASSWVSAPFLVDAATHAAIPLAGAPDHATAADLDIAPDGRHIAFLSEGRWEVFVGDANAVRSLGRQPDARAVAATGDGAVVALQRSLLHLSNDGQTLGRWIFPGSIVVDVAISRDGRLWAAGGADGTIAIWRRTDVEAATRGLDPTAPPVDVTPAALIRSGPGGHGDRIGEIRFGPDALWSASWDGTLRRWGTAALDLDRTTLATEMARRWAMSLEDILTNRQ